ncbi:recombination-associated protein RdgC [Sediminicurvatus halobius]|uniref:Recombination-associated protein RdgC n=1 Tax=Sediminicurvatus halobius TaxID=2182432 RepID=A0A2U2N192_9GAMM|nr:recombination-associated protein RdgC [Spiribacter halobius]PWG62832.1 recombination-associated protein RdgC [Spiribacter halobius]UEX77018.1 recombination-associated protein RdgC [Spiribacter halobius]
MWFRNLCIYELAETWTLHTDHLNTRLRAFEFQPVGGTERSSRGWVSPLGRGDRPLVHVANGRIMVCLQEEARILPPAVVRDELEEPVADREEIQERRLGKRERARMREELYLELLPRAFTRTTRTHAYIDPEERILVVDAASWREGEGLTEDLRAALGTLPIRPLQTEASPQQAMTAWIARDQWPAGVEPGETAVFEDPRAAGSEVRVKRHDLRTAEIRGLIEPGHRVRRLALTWDQRIDCVLDADLSVKQLRFLDVVQDDADDREPESAAERFDADFSIMTLELARFVEAMRGWFTP